VVSEHSRTERDPSAPGVKHALVKPVRIPDTYTVKVSKEIGLIWN
jgi:hypothetical protein